MDFDDEDRPKEVVKTRRFAPGRAGKAKPKPKPEAPVAKPEQPAPQSQETESVSKSEHDVDAKSTGTKVEPEVYNGPVKMEVDSKVDKEPEMTETDFIVEDQLPLQEEKEEEEEEEDVVVREIDVFFKPSIDADTQLYVLQYPLRPSWRPYEMDERCEEVRVNPSTSQVEIDLSMDVHSKNYDSKFGVNVTKQTLKTTWKQPPTLDYAVGVLSGDKLHLNPVHAVAQLRPSMDYLSSDGKKKKAESTEESAGTSKKQNKGAQASMDQKPINEDNWVALNYHGLQSEYCSRYLNGMIANGNSSLDFNMSLDVYINELCHGGSNRNTESKETMKRVLLSLPLKERVQKLLCEGSALLRYSVLKHYASEFSDEDFLEALQEFGWLVQGLWTPKTSLLKLDGPVGASRDYVLCLFSKNTTIKYSEIEAMGRLKETAKAILPAFAKQRPLLNDWKFKEPTDVSFIKSYPVIVEEQDSFHTERKKNLESMMSTQGGKSRVDNRRNIVGKNSSVTVKPEVPTTLSDKGGSSRNTIPRVVRQEMSNELRGALPKALKKVFQTHKVCRYETICQGLRDLAVLTSNNPKADSGMAVNVALAVDAHQDELKDVISEVAVDIHGSFVSLSSPDHPEYDPLREVVISLFRGSPPGTKLMKADVFAAGRNKLEREITNNEYIKVMHELCQTNSSGWILQKAR
ncbi:DNA-directed RNA polymerase III subunit RPC5 [Capsella rubella]|uniref:DNA-directed RNA polymerase III subunit RPC5 n=1 Tax=Capsella rubella TaxID=81985 RepID=UPI000CD58C18|nr:DNA-directed RNA polymerase III subunit RPC5 [Capsella rubella]XP_023639057.1 DNA-directed RNA polymerase III subunit RPC5 [Capsella rubella]